MTAAPAPALTGLTWQEFCALPDDDALRHAELIDGEVVVNPPSLTHQQVVVMLVTRVQTWIEAGSDRGLVTMEPGVQISERRGYLPDAAWYSQDQCSPRDQPLVVTGPPALAVEVLSPSTRLLDAQRKRGDYARVGVRELWLIDPGVPAALVLRREEGDRDFSVAADLDAEGEIMTPLLPGLVITVGDLLRR